MSDAKDIRKQVRNVCQEMALDMLSQELYKQLEKTIMAEIKRRLDIIDERQKDLQAYMVRTRV